MVMQDPPRSAARRPVLRVLELDGTGELRPAQVGSVRIERGSVCVSAAKFANPVKRAER